MWEWSSQVRLWVPRNRLQGAAHSRTHSSAPSSSPATGPLSAVHHTGEGAAAHGLQQIAAGCYPAAGTLEGTFH